MSEPIQWRAFYSDGTTLSQYEGGQEQRYTDIDRGRLTAFAVLKNDVPLVMVHLDPGQQLIYRRRVFVRPDGRIVLHLVGWQQKWGGENKQFIACVNEDGQVDLIGRWRENHAIFGAVQYLPCEEL
jgi:hypothetical protein